MRRNRRAQADKREKPPGSTASSRVAILFEDIQSKMAAVLEAGYATKHVLEEKIEGLGAHLGRRIDCLEFAVRQNSADIKKNSEDIKKNSEDIRNLRELIERKPDYEALLKLEKRVTIIEQRIGL